MLDADEPLQNPLQYYSDVDMCLRHIYEEEILVESFCRDLIN